MELRTQESQDSISPKTPVTPAAPPTRLDSQSSIPYITTPTPPQEDGWGGCGSSEKWPDRGTACHSPPLPKALFLKPTPHQQSPPEETVRDNAQPKENQSPTPPTPPQKAIQPVAEEKEPQQNEIPNSSGDGKQSFTKDGEKHDSTDKEPQQNEMPSSSGDGKQSFPKDGETHGRTETPDKATEKSIEVPPANAPAECEQAKQPPQHPQTSQPKEHQELAALKRKTLNEPPTPRPKTQTYKGGFYWKTLFRYYYVQFFCACVAVCSEAMSLACAT